MQHAEPPKWASNADGKCSSASILTSPVVNVSWHDAVGYAAWLASATGQPWRLPSEAEWEKAARWMGAGTRASIPGATPSTPRAATPARAASRRPPRREFSYRRESLPGAQDMTGNVWEWTSSVHQPVSLPYRRRARRIRFLLTVGWCVAAPGSVVPGSRARRIASASYRSTSTSTSASG